MPTFTAIALDRLIEPGASKTMAAGKYVPDAKPESRNTTRSNLERVISLPTSMSERGINVPRPRMERRNSVSTTQVDKKHHRARISPALYATPESTPLPVVPDSPSSFPRSPYIINHKRRGPRLLKSFSEDDVATCQRALDVDKAAENEKIEEKARENAKNEEKEVVDSDKDVELTFNVPRPVEDDHVNGVSDVELASSEWSNGLAAKNGSMKSVTFNGLRDAELDDFFDPQDTMSVKSNSEGETSGGVERSLNLTTPVAEFYDAWEGTWSSVFFCFFFCYIFCC